MADLSFKIKGDASEAKDAMHEAGLSAEQLKENVHELALEFFAFEKTKEVVVDFVKESVQAYSELQRSQNQLKAVAGELTEEFTRQAEEFEKHYAISLKTTEAMQTLMLRFDAAPEAVRPATQAILDYAAATGHDAEGATQALMRAVERGSDGVKALGIVYKSTGDKTLDLAEATAQLEAKYGGAAETERGGLSGSLRAVAVAQEHVHEAFGKMLNELETRFGVLDKVATVFERIAASLDGMTDGTHLERLEKWSAAISGFGSGGVIGLGIALAASGGSNESPMEGPDASANPNAGAGMSFGKLEVMGRTKYEKGKLLDYNKNLNPDSDADQKEAERLKDEENKEAIHNQKMLELEHKYQYDNDTQKSAWEIQQDKDTTDRMLANQKLMDQALKDREEHDKDMLKATVEDNKKHDDEIRRQLEKDQQLYKQVGLGIGMALLQGIDDAVNQHDSAAVTGTKVAGAIVSTILAAIADYYLPGSGQLVAMGGKLGTDALVKDEQSSEARTAAAGQAPASSHDGSWVEQFHSGGWPGAARNVPIMAQQGERIFSRAEVMRAGGPGAVDSIAQGRGGGGGSVFHLQAFDLASFTGYMGDKGGRGFLNALRIGRGDAALILGRG